jgi:hypothetical protein
VSAAVDGGVSAGAEDEHHGDDRPGRAARGLYRVGVAGAVQPRRGPGQPDAAGCGDGDHPDGYLHRGRERPGCHGRRPLAAPGVAGDGRSADRSGSDVEGTGTGQAMDQPNDIHPAEVVGRFGTPEGARAAVLRLERAGIDGDRITLHLGETATVHPADDEAFDHAVHGAGAAAASIGVVAGAAVGIVAGLVTGDPTLGVAVGSVAAVGGGVVGGLAGTPHDLPAEGDALVTEGYGPGPDDGIEVSVRVDDLHQAEAARDALQTR